MVAENLANQNTTGSTPGAAAYHRRVITFQNRLDQSLGVATVSVKSVGTDKSNQPTKYDPSNPAADAAGNVKYPNVNTMVEMTDMRDAQRSYEANLNVISATRRMIQRTLDILKA